MTRNDQDYETTYARHAARGHTLLPAVASTPYSAIDKVISTEKGRTWETLGMDR